MVSAIFVSCFMIVVFSALFLMARDMGAFKGLGANKTKTLKNRIVELESENRKLRSSNAELETELTAHRLGLPWVTDTEEN